MNTINLPPWLQTSLTVLGALATLVPAIVHLSGQDDTPAGKTILTAGADIVGLWKRLMGPAEEKS